ncbi:hypothetical protein H6G80_27350 [Nostoc sp. FACHB-87]|uniref:hypothetical protein n=1 Tax=Nostocaceae TaxID=1162 RepID=UPI0016878717|nr:MULTISPECIES: hypothetical protein [Nostocaceae]MBD2457772.1 hypothetical protein [Nostoc sp. FACHB-87]MBD2478233.1 hypothetical protein [Anabaena sp. FACHB-83]
MENINITKETPNQQLAVTISPEMQNKVLDQVLIQSSGVGLGIILSVIGFFALLNWLGLKEAIGGWIERQKVESEALKDLTESFRMFLAEYKRDNQDIQTKLQNLYDRSPSNKR